MMKITKEDVQLISQMRSQDTNVKMNLKGKYENFKCEACLLEHVHKCDEILKEKKMIYTQISLNMKE